MGKQLASQVDALEEAVEDAAQGAYDISVAGDAIVINSRSNPRVTVGSVGNDSLAAKAGNTATTSFYVSGRNLASAISIAVTGNDSANWEVSPTSISPGSNGKVGLTLVTITYKPAAGTTAGTSHSCNVVVSSGGTTFGTIAMQGTVVSAPSIVLAPATLNISTPQGTSGTATLNVKGAALEGDISLAISGTGFSLSTNSVSKADAESAAGADVTVTFDGTAAGNATITATTADGSGTATATASVVGTLQAKLTATLDSVMRTGGTIESRSGAFVTDTIPLADGQTIVFNGHANSNTAAIFAESSGTYTMLKKGDTTATLTPYTFTNDSNWANYSGDTIYVGVSSWNKGTSETGIESVFVGTGTYSVGSPDFVEVPIKNINSNS